MPLSLLQLARRAHRRISKLRTLCQDFEISGNWSERDVLATYIAIENANLWARFARELYLMCILNAPVTGKGIAVTYSQPVFSTERDGLLFAIGAVNAKRATELQQRGQKITPRDEPAWHDKNALLKIVQALALSNESSILAAINASPLTLQYMPTIRNFYAHRSNETGRKVSNVQLNYGFASTLHPTEFLGSRLTSRPHTILRHLVDDIALSVTLACF
jgi:hypothetical protein